MFKFDLLFPKIIRKRIHTHAHTTTNILIRINYEHYIHMYEHFKARRRFDDDFIIINCCSDEVENIYINCSIKHLQFNVLGNAGATLNKHKHKEQRNCTFLTYSIEFFFFFLSPKFSVLFSIKILSFFHSNFFSIH